MNRLVSAPIPSLPDASGEFVIIVMLSSKVRIVYGCSMGKKLFTFIELGIP
jgi:hypothetical protein